MNISPRANQGSKAHSDLLQPVRQWLDNVEIRDPKVARLISRLIPAQCPFERDVNLFGRTVAHIPPLCKLNPLYDQFVGLRFRSLCFLVDQCGEDIQSYC
ncbi:Mo-dependent nitrogenase C-terminal domain-containing protein [Oculatella sp. FACHB-28]|uniref:Mo-dependent nitrogenase C-terminal domain-containing protein n=1 Tax=Cyanophyceae TaxID=3028117 RepID=UPI001687C4D3|nr:MULTISPECIES: Mo-dependent nitrogenase C-terminal domain-containing protein [Cyanophyceae]MBD1868268.1 Mo-dependent nitrogenase C-terminal domain-containing protein [Cyanobacteria bacterium FACHB-471]MBD1997606.1 Mo-dependent nitrogenase C-terminal domain-containing protein [Leptolyngbya sp. FACHB-541]MBD2055762.1 Mo-dependent nitrogenase C-terminal domain-containing protein [Oculatella sp. FACHB-28]MBD2069485.1 Mo-dependent nitrogenase C-terminal domain-containing protein [Leptolyngbya sp. 